MAGLVFAANMVASMGWHNLPYPHNPHLWPSQKFNSISSILNTLIVPDFVFRLATEVLYSNSLLKSLTIDIKDRITYTN
ncbi:hypothetical protein CFP56_023628 [Quercus suber]|uniref:Uncharacterized protein n=1 Tax=Quercus suber TaxID=58331 RepID=A0AAW0LYX2_QUESU